MEPNDAAGMGARAHELRASLGTRREVEALLAEASATREAAVADADSIVEEAQQVSDQLMRESRTEADRVATDARERAEGLVGRARGEAEDITRQARAAADAVRARAEAQVEEHRRRVRAELREQVTREVGEQSRRELARVHERQQAMIGDLEASVRILGVSLESAVTTISEMLGALDSLRIHTAESLGEAGASLTSPPRHADTPADELFRDTSEGAGDSGAVETGDSIVDNPGPVTAVPVALSPFDAEDELSVDELADEIDPDELDDDSDPPLTATEAYLRSAHLDHRDPPLVPTDDADVGARYARDAMRATARSRPRHDEETVEGVAERGDVRAGQDERGDHGRDDDDNDEGEASGKPLGWLFRSS
jgi:cell division septum initiation protein DivIVA